MKNFIAVLTFLTLAAASSANLIQNGDFETEIYGPQHQVVTSVTHWNVVGNNVAITHPTYFNTGSIECDLSGVVDQTPGTSGLSQTITTVAGQRYNLSFDVFAGVAASGYSGGVDLYLGSFNPLNPATNRVLTDLEGNRSTVHYSFVATGSSTMLTFISHEGNVSHIDNVVVAAPAPAALASFAVGLVRLRRRRK